MKGDLTILKLLVPGENWQVVADNLGFADAPCADADGNFYYSDMKEPAVYKVSVSDGTKSLIAKEAVSGLEFGPGGLLFGCQGAKKQVISLDPKTGEVKVVATGVTPNDLAVTKDGWIYITETKDERITRINAKTGETTIVATEINKPNGIALSNDQGTLAVSEYGGRYTWMLRVLAMAHWMPSYPLCRCVCRLIPKANSSSMHHHRTRALRKAMAWPSTKPVAIT